MLNVTCILKQSIRSFLVRNSSDTSLSRSTNYKSGTLSDLSDMLYLHYISLLRNLPLFHHSIKEYRPCIAFYYFLHLLAYYYGNSQFVSILNRKSQRKIIIDNGTSKKVACFEGFHELDCSCIVNRLGGRNYQLQVYCTCRPD